MVAFRDMRNSFSVLLAAAALLAALTGARTEAQQATTAPTFTRDVAPILFKQCVSCHRPGEIAPMSLMTYEQARPWAKAIPKVISKRTMPPWHAEAPAGTFNNERLLTDRAAVDVHGVGRGWSAERRPGDLPGYQFTEGWSLGKPDVMLEMPDAYRIPAKGTVPDHASTSRRISPNRNREGDRDTGWAIALPFTTCSSTIAHSLTARFPPIARANEKHQSNPPPDEPGVSEHPLWCPIQGDAAASRRNIRARHEPAGRACRNGISTRARRDYRAADALHCELANRPRTGRRSASRSHQKRRRAKCARSISMNMGMRLPAGAADVAATTDLEFLQDATVWGFSRTRIFAASGGRTDRGARRREEKVLVGSELRLQLADLLYVQGAVAGAEGFQLCVDGVVRQLARRIRANPNPKVEVAGAIRPGKKCIHRDPAKPELIDWWIGRLGRLLADFGIPDFKIEVFQFSTISEGRAVESAH